MIEGLSYFFQAFKAWIGDFGTSAVVGYGYLADYIFTVIIVVILLSFIRRLV